jgi:hypothetical protein
MFQTIDFSGMRVFVSESAIEITTKIKGVADKRRPNTRRPLYRRVTVRKPAIFMVKGLGMVVHPIIDAKIRQHFRDAEKELRVSMMKDLFVAHSQ